MRPDEPHVPARLVVDRTVALVPKHADHRRVRRRFVEHADHEIDQALRLRPLPIEPGREELMVGNDVADGGRLVDVG